MAPIVPAMLMAIRAPEPVKIALDSGLAILNRNVLFKYLSGVRIINTDGCDRLHSLHKALLNSKWAYIAAV